MTAATNTFRDCWLQTVTADMALSTGACLVATAIASSLGLGRVAPTNWQKLNMSLGRDRRNRAVLASITELQAAGYLERYLGSGWAHTEGWRLTLPGEGLT
ncbi:hypothetical protein NCCP2145_14140 [Pseudarthrobacter sp. NCCP-2145]|nr:hypothetical protein NCCP2145_14140 [Pseudarthrobacter sp. NCCP-2145]